LASSAQTFNYVASDYVADGYVHQQHVLIVELVTQESSVSGVAALVRSSSGAIQTDDSIVTGAAERTIVSVEADLTADEVGVVTVAGDGERKVVTQVSAVTVDDNSDVTGLAERIIVSVSGELRPPENNVVG